MAVLFRLRRMLTLTNPSSSFSLLHHHRPLSSTSGSGAGDDPNSITPSPSFLRELKETIKKLSVREYVLVAPFTERFSSMPPFNSNPISYTLSPPPSFNSKEPEPEEDQNDSSAAAVAAASTKLEQLRAKAVRLKQRRDTDRQRVSDLIESHHDVTKEMEVNLEEHLRGEEEHNRRLTVELPETRRNKFDALITMSTRINEMAVELLEFSQELTNSRLSSLYEIVEDLSQMRKFLVHEVWSELNEGLKKGIEMEVKDFELLAQETNLKVAYFQQRITNLSRIRDCEEDEG